jgi:hypothetical protein
MSEDEREKVVKQSDEGGEPEVEAHHKLKWAQDDAASDDDEPDVEAHKHVSP